MSALTDLFTSLANKIRSKLGTTSTYTPAQAIAAIDNVYTKGVTDTKKGNAAVGDVLASKTFTSNTAGVNKTGTIPSKAATIYNTSTTDQTISSGQYLSGTQTIRKVITSGNITAGNIKTGVTMQVGDEGNGGRIVDVAGTFTKSGTQSSGQTVAAAGQIFSGYSAWVDGAEVKGNVPVRSGGGTQALTGGHDGVSAYAYFPYGYYPSYTSISGTSAAYIYIDQSYVKNMHKHSDTWTPSTSQYNSTQAEIGVTHNARYVNTAVCYAAGVADGRNDPRIKYDNEAENVSGGYKSYAVSGLTVGATYGFFLTVIQWSGTFQGVGSGASVTMTNGTVIGAAPGYNQVHCRSSNAGTYGGMVITSRGQFTATATTTYLTFDLKTDQGLFYADWQLFVFGT